MITSRSFAFLLSAAALLPAAATDYYVSATGNDANNGTSTATPWRTVARVNQATYTYQPGDRILFQRGGTYRGEIIGGMSGTAAGYITIGAYGTGDAPIIKGSDLVTGWTQHAGNVWKTTVDRRVDQVYIGGQRLTPARFPNSGWLRNSNASGNTLYSTGLTQPNGYWNGARVVLRRTASSIDTLVVTNYANGTLTFSTSITTLGTDDWGFFMYKKLTELDQAGEWYYDGATKQLYVWAPGNANPNSLQVEASVWGEGVYVYWQRHHLRIEDLHFKHQRNAGVRVDDGSYITVNGCTMEENFHGIRSVGVNCTYSNNTIRRTYASGALLIDNGTLFENNTLTDIALIPGQGEHAWGYFGVRTIGQNIVVRGNRLDNIGYTGLEVNGNALVEKNVIKRANATLNDGGGIAFDNADGITIQDNIVIDPIGHLEGSSTVLPHYVAMGNGIYFGNTNIKNATVRRNTVTGCPGTGINVDHTKVSVNLKVQENILYNNGIQLTVSDYSNYNGPGASPPYYVANFNDEYVGNVMYSLTKDQLTMKQFNCYSASPVDFGTYTGNKFYNPYNETSILVHNIYSGGPVYYSLEKWRQIKGEGVAGAKHPLRQNAQATVSELSGNLVVNGDFTTNVTGWGGWPTNSQVTRVTTHLDNGALKAYLPNNSVYNTFSLRNPDWFPVQSGQWYRVRISLQSDAEGDIRAGLKGQSQLSNPYTVYERQVPFGPERRDLEMYFQSTMTDQAQMQLINAYTDPTYYLDNVQVHRVQVQQLDPADRHRLLINEQATTQTMTLPAGTWSDLDGVQISGTVTVPAYASRIYYKVSEAPTPSSYPVSAKVLLGGAIDWATATMRDNLRTNGLLPNAEPYSARGYQPSNAGVTLTAAVTGATGTETMVDWVLVELYNPAGTTVLSSKAAVLRRDGTIVHADGSALSFPVAVVGNRLAVRHRNHLRVLTAGTIATTGQLVDFTDPVTACVGTDARQIYIGKAALWACDVNGDGVLKYTGVANDRDAILTAVGGSNPTGTASGYHDADTNLDGVVIYVGQYNDRDQLLQNIGGSNPTSTRVAATP